MKVLLELPPLPIRLMIPLKLRGSKPGTETGQKTMVYLIEKLWSSISKFTIIQKTIYKNEDCLLLLLHRTDISVSLWPNKWGCDQEKT